MFGYLKSQSNAELNPGEKQTYAATIYNTTASPITNVTFLDVLPYNSDLNGTVGLIDSNTGLVGDNTSTGYYLVSDFLITSATSPSSLNLYYTTDLAIRASSTTGLVTAAGTVTWIPWTSGIGNLPAGVTALRWTATSLPAGSLETLSFNLNSFTPPATAATMINSISLTQADTLVDAFMVSPMTAKVMPEVLTLNLSQSSINLSITPSVSGTSASDYLSTTVTTNNTLGYNMSLGSTTNSLTCSTIPTAQISSLSGTNTTLTNNTWGYAITTLSTPTPSLFSAIPTTPATIKSTSTASPLGDISYIHFGARINYAIPACSYVGEVVVSVVGN